jgi:hypothetical protein
VAPRDARNGAFEAILDHRTMRPFTLLKLLTVSSLLTSTNCLSSRYEVITRSAGRAQRLKQTSMSPTNECTGAESQLVTSETRRRTLHSILAGGLGSLTFISNEFMTASALDMDAFMNAEVIKKLDVLSFHIHGIH